MVYTELMMVYTIEKSEIMAPYVAIDCNSIKIHALTS